MILLKARVVSIVTLIIVFFTATAFAQDGIQYKSIKKGKTNCDVGILYKPTPEGMDIEVSAIATGKGIDFRLWEVTAVKLKLEGDILRPVKTEKFYFAKSSFFQGAAPLLFAAIGAQYTQYGTQAQSGEVCPVTGEPTTTQVERGSVAKAIDKTGMSAGLGLLASQAAGEIDGLKCTFNLDQSLATKIGDGKGAVKIDLKHRDKHEKKTINIDLAKLYVTKVDFPFDYNQMSQDDLLNLVNIFEDDIKAFEQYQKSFRYSDPEYAKTQDKIKQIRDARDKAYKKWSERKKQWIEGHKERIAKGREVLEEEEKQRAKKQEEFKKWQQAQEERRKMEQELAEARKRAEAEKATRETIETGGKRAGQTEQVLPTKQPDWITGGKAAIQTMLEEVGGGPVPTNLIDIEYEIYDNWNDGIRMGIAQTSYNKFAVESPGFEYIKYNLEDFAPPKLDGTDKGSMWRWWEKEEYKNP